MEHDSAFKKKEILSFATAWTALSDRERQIPQDFSYTWGLNNNVKEKTGTDSQLERTD